MPIRDLKDAELTARLHANGAADPARPIKRQGDEKRGASETRLEKFAAKVRPEPKKPCLLYTSPSPRDRTRSRMPSSA